MTPKNSGSAMKCNELHGPSKRSDERIFLHGNIQLSICDGVFSYLMQVLKRRHARITSVVPNVSPKAGIDILNNKESTRFQKGKKVSECCDLMIPKMRAIIDYNVKWTMPDPEAD